jgi:hypothetical protein
MRRILIALVLAVLVAGSYVAVHPRHHASTQAEFFCVFSTSLTLKGHTVTTPTVCIPSPAPPPA